MTKTMVVKVQLSLASSDGKRHLLIYNKDRTLYVERLATQEDINMVKGKSKSFWVANYTDEVLHLLKPARWEEW